MKINQKVFEEWKRKHSGTYQKFNTEITKWHLSKMFDYDYLLETATKFNLFGDFYNFHTEQKQDLINETVLKMYNEAVKKGMNISENDAFEMLVVRLGNAYNGIYRERVILDLFNNLSTYITCTRTDKNIDTNYKVDGIVELSGIDKLAIQIKPISFLSYGGDSELVYHNRFELEFGCKVYYVFYKGNYKIIFNNIEIDISNKGKIVEQIENILVYNN